MKKIAVVLLSVVGVIVFAGCAKTTMGFMNFDDQSAYDYGAEKLTLTVNGVDLDCTHLKNGSETAHVEVEPDTEIMVTGVIRHTNGRVYTETKMYEAVEKGKEITHGITSPWLYKIQEMKVY